MPGITVTQACKSYETSHYTVKAVNHANLSVESGEAVAIVGPSGTMRRSGIAVHRLFCSGHFSSSVFIRVYCISARVSCRTGPRLSVWRPVVCSGRTDR